MSSRTPKQPTYPSRDVVNARVLLEGADRGAMLIELATWGLSTALGVA